MKGQTVSANPAQSWSGNLPGLGTPDSGDTQNVSKVSPEPSLTADGFPCNPALQENKDVTLRKVVPVENTEGLVAKFAENFTKLIEEAIWNVDTLEHEPQPNPRLPSPVATGNLTLGSVPTEEYENGCLNPLLQSYNIVDLKESDEQVCNLLKGHMVNIGEILQTKWSLLNEESQQKVMTEIRALYQLLTTFSSEELATILERESSKLETVPKIEHLQSLHEAIHKNYQKLAAILQPTEPFINQMNNLRKALRPRIHLLKLNQLEGLHKASDFSWATCNERTCQDPKKINQNGLAEQFDKDILRSSNFAIFNSEGLLQFHSAVKNHECQQEDTENKSERFKNECQKQLIEFCDDYPNKTLAVVSDLTCQTPYNLLYQTFNDLITEKLGPGYWIAPQERKIETRILPQPDGMLTVVLTLSFTSYKLTSMNEDNNYQVDQPVLIKSSITLDPERLEERKLDDIDLRLLAATSCTNIG